MMKKTFQLLIVTVIFVLGLQTKVLASELKLSVTIDKEKYEIGEKVEAVVGWTEEMQAASFTIKYDSQNLKFISADIASDFYNTKNEGTISVNWASFEEKKLTQIKFEFKAIQSCRSNIEIEEVQAFADENLIIPTNYDIKTSGKKNITILNKDGTEPKEEPSENEQEQQPNNQLPEKENETLIPEKLPEAGTKKIVLIMTSCMTILSVMLFMKNRKFSGI